MTILEKIPLPILKDLLFALSPQDFLNTDNVTHLFNEWISFISSLSVLSKNFYFLIKGSKFSFLYKEEKVNFIVYMESLWIFREANRYSLSQMICSEKTFEKYGSIASPIFELGLAMCDDINSHNFIELMCSNHLYVDLEYFRLLLQYGAKIPKGTLHYFCSNCIYRDKCIYLDYIKLLLRYVDIFEEFDGKTPIQILIQSNILESRCGREYVDPQIYPIVDVFADKAACSADVKDEIRNNLQGHKRFFEIIWDTINGLLSKSWMGFYYWRCCHCGVGLDIMFYPYRYELTYPDSEGKYFLCEECYSPYITK